MYLLFIVISVVYYVDIELNTKKYYFQQLNLLVFFKLSHRNCFEKLHLSNTFNFLDVTFKFYEKLLFLFLSKKVLIFYDELRSVQNEL